MPTGPHRFGCGEIATGFKAGGYPPGFFNHPRIVPRPGGGGSTGGNRGGGGGRFECYVEQFSCEFRYPGLNYEGTILEPSCREDPEGSFASESDCENAIGGPTGIKECPKVDTCKGKKTGWECVETKEVCPGYEGQKDPPFKYKRSCQETPNGKHTTEAECEKSIGPGTGGPGIYCSNEDKCPDPPVGTPTVGPTTGRSIVRFSCVTGPKQTCIYPNGCGVTGTTACFNPKERYDRTCTQCKNCVETNSGAVTCDIPKGGGPCIHLMGAGCGAGCGDDDPCPQLTNKKHCTTTSRTDCWDIYQEQGVGDVSRYPEQCQSSKSACEQTERECDDAVSWTTGGNTCCCVPSRKTMVKGGCKTYCTSQGAGANCVTKLCPPLVGDPPTSNPWL
tara:strand:- start:1007 stop:2176 length:1170 start_codon:yes stop_codon:yes gene_type:complete